VVYTDLIDRPDGSVRGRQPVTPGLYFAIVAVTGALAVAQFYFLPNNLGAVEFGYVVLALSLLQAGLQLSDLGLINASLRTDLPSELRVQLRVNAVGVASVVCFAGIGACAILAVCGFGWALVAAAALFCAVWLIGDRAHASAAAQCGAETTTSRYNVVWQNAPKAGSIAGSFGGTALIAMLGAIVTSMLLRRPQFPSLPKWSFLQSSWRVWLPGLGVSATAFLLTWTETYLLSAVVGVAEAGQYQAVVRPLTGITYLYLPLVALIQAAHNANAQRRVRRLTALALGLGVLGSAAIGAVLLGVGHAIWPDFRFDTAVVIPAVVAGGAICAAAVIGVQLVLRGHHVAASVITAIGAVVLLLTSLYTVPSMGAAGAALSSATAWSVVVLGHLLFLFTVRRRAKEGLA
jgi:O-antigen/teichoic acid export membrane protein